MIEANEVLLERYLQLPNRLEAAIAGLSESDLDLRLDEGWTIRQSVHHVVEGEYIWQLNLRAIVGTDGILFPSIWYFALPQEEWVKRWAYDKRPLEPALALWSNFCGTFRMPGIISAASRSRASRKKPAEPFVRSSK
jgi:hypothetical protein